MFLRIIYGFKNYNKSKKVRLYQIYNIRIDFSKKNIYSRVGGRCTPSKYLNMLCHH